MGELAHCFPVLVFVRRVAPLALAFAFLLCLPLAVALYVGSFAWLHARRLCSRPPLWEEVASGLVILAMWEKFALSLIANVSVHLTVSKCFVQLARTSRRVR